MKQYNFDGNTIIIIALLNNFIALKSNETENVMNYNWFLRNPTECPFQLTGINACGVGARKGLQIPY